MTISAHRKKIEISNNKRISKKQVFFKFCEWINVSTYSNTKYALNFFLKNLKNLTALTKNFSLN